jgi:phospholipase C
VGGYARQGHIESATLDYTSILKFIEENWSLAPLASRDAAAGSIAGAFDFASPPREPIFFGIDRAAPVPEPDTLRWVIYISYSVPVAILGVTVWFASRGARSARRRRARIESGAREWHA